MAIAKPRCAWPGHDPLLLRYHDTEWGVPVHDDAKHFEFMLLDSFQAGLSWRTILYKRKGFENAFAQFDPVKIAAFGEQDISRLMANQDIIRHGQKIRAAIRNAQAFMALQAEHGSFDKYVWQFVDGKTVQNAWPTEAMVPTQSPASEHLSRDLKQRGFNFVGPTIMYAYMQGAGLINDHVAACYRHTELWVD